MAHVIQLFRGGIFAVAVVLAAIAAILLFAVIAVAARPLLMGGLLLAALVAVVVSIFSPSFRSWLEAAGERETRHSGLRLATDVAVDPNHTWIRFGDPEHVTVGADDFVQAALGPADVVELPRIGSRIQRGDRLFSIRRGNRTVVMRAPMAGTVVGRNESLLAHPGRINSAPFTAGWVARLRVEDVREQGRLLMRGKQAREWFRREIDRLVSVVLASDELSPALPDGGLFSDDLYRHIDDKAWTRLTREFFDTDET